MTSIEDEMETPPWEDRDGAQEGQSEGTEDKIKNKPDGAAPQGDSPWNDTRAYCAPPRNGAQRDFGECKAATDYLDRIGGRLSSMDTAIIETGEDKDGYRARWARTKARSAMPPVMPATCRGHWATRLSR
jgi:hypothetical protein